MDKISLLEQKIQDNKLDFYLVTSFDEFQNEFTPDNLNRLKWLTGFTGSNGIAIMTNTKKHYFLTDGRYTSQAKLELNNKTFDIYNFQDIDKLSDILIQTNQDIIVGYDPFIITQKYLEYLKQYFKKNKKFEFHAVEENLVDKIWERKIEFKTKAPSGLDAKYTSENETEKISKLLSYMKTDYMLFTSPESICWLLNIRGNDLAYTPLIFFYSIISKDGEIELFSYLTKFKSNYPKIKLSNFSEFKKRIFEINKSSKTIELDPSRTPIWFMQNIDKKNLILKKDPCQISKSIKNSVELSGFKYAAIQDGIALTKLFVWIEECIGKNDKITEIDVDKKLSSLKQENQLFKTKSFETISAFAENSAVIHYNPYNGNNKIISNDNFYLLDSGSQYSCGTTDVTRTFHFGNITDEQKLHYTLVLKGLINLSKLKFPKGTTGNHIDAIARQFLWNHGLDYNHGTGHGVGHYLSVHEGPQGISKNNNNILYPGMVLSIEPGFYIQDAYGIRLENLVYVKAVDENFLKFETITLAPISYAPVDKALLTQEEKDWLIQYNTDIYKILLPFIDQKSRDYLKILMNNKLC
ncbi:MAG: Xaa-Pro aminopeptidase [Candidatus Midichloriaceae bacterium]|jgi:Xaa-Pro aminopeptidase